MVNISVIIPAYNCGRVLARCLDALYVQDHARLCEVIIVDDGSGDGTETTVKEKAGLFRGKLKFFRQEHRGPAAARNLGVRNSSGDIALFLGADMVADAGLLEEHLARHDARPEENVAVLGHISWAPEIRLTPFLKWLEEGPQFAYPLIRDPNDVPYRFFYSSNISLKRRFLLEKGLFDEDFPSAAFEDTELGYRLTKEGLRVVYDPKALVFHEHLVDQKSFEERSRLAGRSLKILLGKHPELVGELQPRPRRPIIKMIASIAWGIPQPLARFVPKMFLYPCYQYMVACFMDAGRSDAGREQR